jgi:hypothetical protein
MASAIPARTAIAAGASVGLTREAGCGCPAELEVAFDLGSRAAVEPFENPFTILHPELVEQSLSADSLRLSPGALLLHDPCHRLSEVPAVGDTYRSPFTRPANRALLSPPPRDDEEIVPAEDRPSMLAACPDAAMPVGVTSTRA